MVISPVLLLNERMVPLLHVLISRMFSVGNMVHSPPVKIVVLDVTCIRNVGGALPPVVAPVIPFRVPSVFSINASSSGSASLRKVPADIDSNGRKNRSRYRPGSTPNFIFIFFMDSIFYPVQSIFYAPMSSNTLMKLLGT